MNTELLVENNSKCCGCGACKNACPTSAITLIEDAAGFTYPVIDELKCIDCKKCISTCGFKKPAVKPSVQTAYAAVTSDKAVLSTSASGGVFYALSKAVIDLGGTVFGCAYQDMRPMHIAVNSEEGLKPLQGSKYVQSDAEGSFKKVKELLDNNSLVLFSGTPCQIDGLKNYLRKDYENLFTVDIICHGVPSTKMFLDYIALLERKYKGKITDFKFRCKETNDYGIAKAVINKNGKIKTKYLPEVLSSYFHYFLKGHIYRESCYNCKYANLERVSDITIGDYWGIEKMHPEYANDGMTFGKGVSSIIVNTEKGAKLLESAKGLILKPSTAINVAKENAQLNHPHTIPKEREAVISAYKIGGYTAVDKYYKKSLGLKWHVYKLKNGFSSNFKKKLKKILTLGRAK